MFDVLLLAGGDSTRFWPFTHKNLTPFLGKPLLYYVWKAVRRSKEIDRLLIATDNPLVVCATNLLTVAGQLRGTASHPDPEGLRERLIGQMREFEQCARAKGLITGRGQPRSSSNSPAW